MILQKIIAILRSKRNQMELERRCQENITALRRRLRQRIRN